MTKEIIEGMRKVIVPFVKKRLVEINYEGLGESDAKELDEHMNEILDLATKALEQKSCSDVPDISVRKCEDAINREQAIKTAIEAADDWDGGCNLTRADIIEKAIKALPSVKTNPIGCSDAISRNELIKQLEYVRQLYYKTGKTYSYKELPDFLKIRVDEVGDFIILIKGMPSAQPKLTECEDAPSAQPTQSIAEWQKDFREYINTLNILNDDYKGIMEYINDVPSAQPKILACGEGELDVPDTNAGDTIMKEVFGLIEDVLDTLIEVGNGTTDEMLHEAANKLFRVRDLLEAKS